MKRALVFIGVVGLGLTGAVVVAQSDSDPTPMADGTYICDFEPATFTCTESTTPTSSTTTTTTTTEVPTTTTEEPTTTTSTVVPTTTTTTLPPTTSTSVPDGGATFIDGFESDTLEARFDFGWSGQHPWTWPDHAGPIRSFDGDHDHACGAPTTSRTIDVDASIFNDGVDGDHGVIWWCAPGGDPARAHLMTGVNTAGYNIVWFAPERTFTDVTKICWDQNLTDLGGGKWTQVVVVSEDEAVANDGDLGFTGPGFQDPNGPTTGIHPADPSTVTSGVGGAKMFGGDFQVWRGGDFTGDIGWWTWDGVHHRTQTFSDKAARFTHCMTDNEDGTMTLTQERPSGVTAVTTTAGSLPDGDVHVAFQDDNYDPDKHGGTSTPGDPRYTWHWDNVEIYAAN